MARKKQWILLPFPYERKKELNDKTNLTDKKEKRIKW